MAKRIALRRLFPPAFLPGPFSVRAATDGFTVSEWIPVRLRCPTPRFWAFPVPGIAPHPLTWLPVLL